MSQFQKLILEAGAEYIGTRGDSVVFRDPQTLTTLSLYTHALRTVHDVRLALKSAREPVVGFEPLLPTE
jgi:hypothetical protein